MLWLSQKSEIAMHQDTASNNIKDFWESFGQANRLHRRDTAAINVYLKPFNYKSVTRGGTVHPVITVALMKYSWHSPRPSNL